MVPESVSFVVMLRASLPDSCKLPLLIRVDAVKLYPFRSRVAPALTVNTLEIFAFLRRETSGFEIVSLLKLALLFIVCTEVPLMKTVPVPGTKLFALPKLKSPWISISREFATRILPTPQAVKLFSILILFVVMVTFLFHVLVKL